jgi:hypothetical protein
MENPENPPIVTSYTDDSIVYRVVKKFNERSKVGIEKYGTTLDRTDLSTLDWIQHAQEEFMDGILYLEKLKQTILEKK